MARCQKADTTVITVLRVGTNQYKADLFRDFHEIERADETKSDVKTYDCETVRISTAYTFENEESARTFFMTNFDALFETELHNEELDAKSEKIASSYDFLNQLDYVWFKALEYTAQHKKTLTEAINYILSAHPTFFTDRQNARNTINGEK